MGRMKQFSFTKLTLLWFIVSLLTPVGATCLSQILSWQPTKGPYGAYGRCIGTNLRGHLYVGTDAGLYTSTNNGSNWKLEEMIGLQAEIASVFTLPGGVILVGTRGQGIFRSTNDGATWSNVWLSNRNSAMSFAKADTSLIFLGSYQDGLYRTSDEGRTWAKAGLGSNSAIGLTYTSQRVLLAASDSGVFRSTDKGETWSFILLGAEVQSIAQAPNEILFATTFGLGIFRSTDQGISWDKLKSGVSPEYFGAVGVDSTGRIFVAAQDGIIYSTDSGDSWSRLPSYQDTDVQLTVYFHPNGSIFVGAFHGVFRSTDGGKNWSQCNEGLLNTSVDFITSDKFNTVFAIVRGRGLFRSRNCGDSWEQLSDAIVWGLTTSPDGDVYVGASPWPMNEIWRTSDGGDHWEKKAAVQNFYFAGVTVGYRGEVYATDLEGRIFMSGDGGTSWKQIRNSTNYYDVAALRVTSKGHLFLASKSEGIFRSTNEGKEWEHLFVGLPTGRAMDLVIDPLGTIYAVHEKGFYRSVDDGNHWDLINGQMVYCEKLALNNNQDIFLTWSGRVFRSTDGGVHWVTEAPLDWVISMTVTPSGYIFAGTIDQGVYKTASTTATLPVRQQVLQNFPNPFNSSTTLRFDLASPTFVDLSIFNTLGQKVETIVGKVIPAGRYFYQWDARNLSSGAYFARFITPGSVSTKKLLLLK